MRQQQAYMFIPPAHRESLMIEVRPARLYASYAQQI